MSNKQKKRVDNAPKPSSIVHKKWSHIHSRLSPKVEADAAFKHMHDRMLFLIINLVGRIISVSLKNGVRYKGILGTVNTDSDMGLVLKMATLIDTVQSDTSNQANGLQYRVIDELIILPRDLMQIQVERINFNEILQTEHKFQTDTEISGKVEFKERELHRWEPSNSDSAEIGPLEELTQTVSNGEVWDQFAVNEKLFGVKSEFDEDFYTTKVDKSHPFYKQREAEAARIAQEIQQSSTNNIHIAEERGFIQTDISEETMYSGVFRPDSEKKDESSDYTKETKKETVSVVAASCEDSATTTSQTKSEAEFLEENATVASVSVTKEEVETPDSDSSSSALKAPKIETELMGTFKQFVSGERKRLQAKKQALFKKEKYVKLQELLKFSQDFKLNTPVPSDLVPILAKDKAKRDEIIAKSATTSPVTPTPTPDPSQQSLDSLNDSQNVKKNPQKLNMKLNVKASIFKPNSMNTSYSQYVQKMEGLHLDMPMFQPPQAVKASVPLDFFNNKKPDPVERKPLLKKFDPFKRYRLEHPDNEYSSEKPYSFVPTWPCGDKSYKELLQAFQQSLNLSQLGQLSYDSNEDYRFPYIGPNSLNFIPVPYGAPSFYPTQQDTSYGVSCNAYRNFVPTQVVHPAYSIPGHVVKLLHMTPHIVQNMAYHPHYGIYMPPQMMNPQNYNSQTGQPTVNYADPRNASMMMQFHPNVHGQNGLQQAVMMTMPTGMNKVMQGQTYGYTG